jgi:hypothetical protein
MGDVAVRVESADMETRLVGRQRRWDQRLVQQPTEPLGKFDTPRRSSANPAATGILRRVFWCRHLTAAKAETAASAGRSIMTSS